MICTTIQEGVRSSYSAVELPMDGEGSGENSRSISTQDKDMGVDPPSGYAHYDSVPRRTSSDWGIANSHQKVFLLGGSGPSHYEQMVHPRNCGMQGYDGYIFMKPAENNSRAIPAPTLRNPPLLADNTYHHLQCRPSPQNSSSTINYDQLPTISERHRSKNYENHPLPRDLKNMSEYRPNYENVET